MLLLLANYFKQFYHGFDVFHYITLRTILSTLTSLVLAFMIGPSLIRYLSNLHMGQIVRDDGPKAHLSKAGTPTMGGVLILFTIVLSTLLWGDLHNTYIWILIF